MPLRFMTRIEAALASTAVRAHRRPAVTLLLTGLLVVAAARGAAELRLDNDLAALLPGSFESVQGFEKLKQKFGGVGYIAVAGYDADRAGLERFAEELAPRLEALPNIRFVESRRESPFFEERALYYLSLEDLGEIAGRVKARERYERRQRNPMYIKLDQEEVPSLDFSDIEGKYAGASSRRLSGSERYYLDPQQRMVVLMAKPVGNSLDLDFSVQIVREVEDLIASMDLRRYGPTFKVQLTGAYKKKVDGQAQIVRDVARSSLVALVLLLGYLLLHFRSVVAVAFNLLPVAAGLVWTYGIVGAVYGSVNLLTAFAGAILGGLSVEHGIHLLGRYESLRAAGESSERATGEAFSHTGSAALIAALVAALTFLSLAVSDFRVFREFGFIAAFGMVVAIAAYLLVLPALIGIASRLGWRPTSAWLRTNRASRLAHWLQRPRFRQSVVAVTVVALGAALWNARNARFDFDISALEDSSMPSFVFDKTTNRLLGYSQTPVVVLTPDAQSERAVVDELNRRKRQRGAASGVDFVAALDDLVPQQQVDKQQVLASMAEVLGRVKRDGLPPETRGRFDQLARMVAAKPFTRADLPVGVRRQFLGIDEGQTGFVLVFPSISLSDGARVRDFAREVRSIELPGGGRLSAAGEAMMLADIIDMVAREMPLIFATALVSIVLAMALTLGSLKLALLCMSPTLVSIFALFGLVPACGLTFNYLNVIVLTVLIGVTVDAGVHMVSRLTTPGEDFVAVYGETGRAIAGGILTSALGFGAMWLADHPGLQSVGQLANLGFATNLVMMLLVFPAVALPFLRRRRPDPEPVAAPAEGSGSEGQRFGVRAGGQGGR